MTSSMLSLHGTIQWSDELSMQELVEWFMSLPEPGYLTIVTTGYLGCDQMNEIGSDEIYWIKDIERQRRIVVKDVKGRFLSIPKNYRMEFEVTFDDTPDAKLMTIEEMLEVVSESSRSVRHLMIKNNEKVSFNVGPNAGCVVKLGRLKYVDVYDEKYLVVYNIDGRDIHNQAFVIPVYMPIAFATADDFKQQDIGQRHFRQWLSSIRQLVNSFETQPVQMCQEILMLSDKPVVGLYEYVKPSMFALDDGKKSSKSSTSDNDENSSDYEEIVDRYVKVVPTSPTNPQRPATLVSRTPAGGKGSFTARTYQLPMIPCLPPKQSRNSISDEVPERPVRVPSSAHTQPVPETKQPNRKPETGEAPGRPSPRPPPPAPTSTTAPNTQSKPKSKPPPPLPKTSREPIASPATSADERRPSNDGSPDTVQSCTSASDVPNDFDMALLSVADVSHCLHLLKLDAYIDRLANNDVDGRLLSSLDEPMLVGDFGFKKFDAMKLMQFIKMGWRPREN